MRGIIHIGMPKTGSTYLQFALNELNDPQIYYPKTVLGNHSGAALILFHPEAHEVDGFKIRNIGPEDISKMRLGWIERIKSDLSAGSFDTFIFSAERLFDFGSLEGLQNLRSFFDSYCEELSVIGYIRPPKQYLSSWFQQKIKGQKTDFSLEWPEYQTNISRLDTVFGQDRVKLKLFDRSHLHGDDLISDFSHEYGLTLNPIERVNESLSLEAVALLYTQRRLGRGELVGSIKNKELDREFVRALATIGERKFRFSQRRLNDAIAPFDAEVDWLKQRLGVNFNDDIQDGPDAVSTETQLFDIALENFEKIAERVGGPASRGTQSLNSLVSLLDDYQRSFVS